MKRYLAAQPPAGSLALLQAQLDAFVRRYNDARPHRSLGRRTPRSVYETKVKATPATRVQSHFRVRYDKVDRHGKLSLRYDSRLLHIGLGARFKGQSVVMLVADRDVRVVSAVGGELLRHLTLDPSRSYQRQSA